MRQGAGDTIKKIKTGNHKGQMASQSMIFTRWEVGNSDSFPSELRGKLRWGRQKQGYISGIWARVVGELSNPKLWLHVGHC